MTTTGFTIGSFPIKYLGLPLSPKKWNKLDCHQLVQKITNRVKTGYAGLLSYAGRLQIINAVLFSIHNFWGAVFILPQSVLKEVEKVCKEYLWGKRNEQKKISLVAWEKVCLPKKVGGLNIKDRRNWNIAAVGKLLWQLAGKIDLLWVNWVHGIYMKDNTDIWSHQVPADCRWYWRKLNSLKERMRAWYTQDA